MVRFEIEKLVGLDLSSVEGANQTSPVSLEGIDFDRRGGYQASGALTAMNAPDSPDFQFIGYDNTGLAGLGISTTFRLFSMQSFSEVTSSNMSVSFTYGFVERAGVHGRPGRTDRGDASSSFTSTGAFAIQDDDGMHVTNQTISLNPFFLSVTASGAGSFSGSPQFIALRTINTPSGKYVFELSGETDIASGSGFEVSFSGGAFVSNSYVEVYMENSSSNGTLTLLEVTKDYSKTIQVTDFPVGPQIPTSNAIWPFMISFESTAVSHNRRIYGRPNPSVEAYYNDGFLSPITEPFEFFVNLPASSLIYSEIGWVNLGGTDNWFTVPFTVSDEITGLASTPAGLLIFGAYETFLMRSDPALNDFQLQKFSGTTGHDSDYPPAVLGGIVFCVFDGDVYAINLGMGDVDFGSGITKISEPFDGRVIFERVAAEGANNVIVALGDSGEAYRFNVNNQKWSNSSLEQSSSFDATSYLFPSVSESGVAFFAQGNSAQSLRPFGGLNQDDMNVKWEDVDLGDKNLKKMWRRVYAYMNDGYSGPPVLAWDLPDGRSGSITGTQLEGGLQDSRWVFTFPSGLVSNKIDIELRLFGAAAGDTLEPPVVIEAAPRYRQR